MVPTIRAYTGALASRRKTIRSRKSPMSGAKTSTAKINAGTMGIDCPTWSW